MKQSIYDLLPTRLYLELKWLDFKFSQPNDFKLAQQRRMQDINGYGFRGFDEKKAIFIHIPKCAGISVAKSLFGNLGGGHNTLEQYSYIFPPKELLSYFKFTFVRNPWDRLVSAYHFLKAGGITEADAKFFDEHLSEFYDFNEFVLEWVNEENIWLGQHFRPQVSYLEDKRKKLKPDFIGKFESIEQDYAYICNKLGVAGTLPKTNQSNRMNFRNYYTPDTIEIVRRVYKKDIEGFNYDFE